MFESIKRFHARAERAFQSFKYYVKCLAWTAVFFVIAGFCAVRVADGSQLILFGVSSQGTLRNATATSVTKKNGESHPVCEFDYQFTIGRQTNSGRCRVSSQTYSLYKKGDKIPITYLPSDPTINAVGGSLEIVEREGPLAAGTIFFGVIGLLGIWAARNRSYVEPNP